MHTALHGWSLTKSIVNALIGTLVRRGKLSVQEPAAVSAWSQPGDPRHQITVDQLLRMTSGLGFDHLNGRGTAETRLLYTTSDMAALAETAQLQARPGTYWEYNSASTVILSRVIRDALGGHADDVLDFARRELFNPLGMHTARMEFDRAESPVGAAFGYASARDWGRLGMLYLDDGVVNGERVLPGGWVRYSSAPTLGTNYAAGFWTTIGQRQPQMLPLNSFYASGILGQFIVVVPSERLVVVRLASTWLPGGDLEGVGRLVADVIAALHSP